MSSNLTDQQKHDIKVLAVAYRALGHALTNKDNGAIFVWGRVVERTEDKLGVHVGTRDVLLETIRTSERGILEGPTPEPCPICNAKTRSDYCDDCEDSIK